MVRCVNKGLEDCGSDAVSILDGLLRAQVPPQIASMCQESIAEPSPAPKNFYQGEGGSVNIVADIVTCSLSLLFAVLAIHL